MIFFLNLISSFNTNNLLFAPVSLFYTSLAEAGNLIVGADGVVQVIPDSIEEREQLCSGFSNTINSNQDCTAIEFCSFDEKTGLCGATPDVQVGIIILIIVIVLFVLLFLYWFVVIKNGRGNSGNTGWAAQKSTQSKSAPVAVAHIPGPPPNKPGASKKPLQSGWKPRVDPSSGDTYYYNESTGATTWERSLIEM